MQKLNNMIVSNAAIILNGKFFSEENREEISGKNESMKNIIIVSTIEKKIFIFKFVLNAGSNYFFYFFVNF